MYSSGAPHWINFKIQSAREPRTCCCRLNLSAMFIHTIRTIILMSGLGFVALAHGIVLVDDFTQGPFSVSHTGNPMVPGDRAFDFETGLNTWGSSRGTFFHHSTLPGQTWGGDPSSFSLSGGLMQLTPAANMRAGVEFYYGPTTMTPTTYTYNHLRNFSHSSVNLLRVYVDSAPAGLSLGWKWGGRTNVGSTDTQYAYPFATIGAITTPTIVNFALPAVNVGFYQGLAQGADYAILGLSSTGNLRISRLELVPEPATLLAVSTGLVALLRRRRHAQNA